jgi:hypothetical protein
MNGRELVHELSDDYEDLRRGRKTPRQLFEKENNIK